MEMVLSEFTKQVIISLGNLAGNEIAKVLCVKNEISRLSRKLDSMTAIIRDAEQTVMQNETTRDWLKRSREIIYEAENITDRCRIERERFQTLQPQVRKCLDSSLIFILYLQGWIFALWFFFGIHRGVLRVVQIIVLAYTVTLLLSFESSPKWSLLCCFL
jgi:hypothetical protein